MPDLTIKELLSQNCGTDSEPFALQNLGLMMTPEFSENCMIIIDPTIPLHNKAYAVIEYKNELYFRQYIKKDNKEFMHCLNPMYKKIALTESYKHKGCVVQQKQRKQKALHYYHLNPVTKNIDFTAHGKAKIK